MFITGLFLIFFAAIHFKFESTEWAVLVVGYIGMYELDRWARRRRLTKIFEVELTGWVQDKEDADFESKGEISRKRLPNDLQVLLTRMSELIVRLI